MFAAWHQTTGDRPPGGRVALCRSRRPAGWWTVATCARPGPGAPSAALTPITAAVFVLTRVTEQTWSRGAQTVQGSQHEQAGTHALRAWSTCRRGPARRRTPPYDAEANTTAPTARLVTRLLVLEDPGEVLPPGVLVCSPTRAAPQDRAPSRPSLPHRTRVVPNARRCFTTERMKHTQGWLPGPGSGTLPVFIYGKVVATWAWS